MERTNLQLIAIYRRALRFRPSEWEDHQETADLNGIADEMRQVIEAPSDRAAGDIIRYWGGWGDYQPFRSATACARAIRKEASE